MSEIENVEPTVTAESYVTTELKKTKDNLLKFQIGAGLSVLVLGGYLLGITNHFKSSLEPVEAATIAKGLISTKVDEQGPQLAEYIKKEVPSYMDKAPDYIIKELPNYRADLEDRLHTEVKHFADSSAEQLGHHVDTFLENNKDSVQTLILNGQDPETTDKISKKLKLMFVSYLNETQVEGETLQQKLDSSLEALKDIDAKMKKLAKNKNLTPSEQSARRAIAVLLNKVHEKRDGQESPIVELPKITHEG